MIKRTLNSVVLSAQVKPKVNSSAGKTQITGKDVVCVCVCVYEREREIVSLEYNVII